MHYYSTRNTSYHKDFAQIVLEGLSPEGGLYWPKNWPHLSQESLISFQKLSYQDLAFEIFSLFVGPAIPSHDLKTLIDTAYEQFSSPLTPLRKLNDHHWLLELYHGPTLSFKDFALQFLSQVMDYLCQQQNIHKTIIVATSGDTGSAALEAFQNCQNINIVVLHPYQRISDIQRRQMTTIHANNILNIAIEGTFDDCQNMVKSLFLDDAFNKSLSLTAVNSINWCRIMAQMVYYIYASIHIGPIDQKINFAVPTGNFGNILAGYCAKKMGAPIHDLLICSNENDVLPRFFQQNHMSLQKVIPTYSPSMDIQISSNFERFLFDICDQDASYIIDLMEQLHAKHTFTLTAEEWQKAKACFSVHTCSNPQTLAIIAEIYQKHKICIDPHTATAIDGAFTQKSSSLDHPTVILSTAHPAKFPDIIQKAIHILPKKPKKLASLDKKQEDYTILPNDIEHIKNKIQNHF